MDERCKSAHAKLLAGKCPWCGQYIIAGELADARAMAEASSPDVPPDAKTLQQLVEEKGVLSYSSTLVILKLIAKQLSDYHESNGLLRRLSPSQVLFLEDGVLISEENSMLDEFSSESIDESREVLGLADYLAPEQALNSLRADGRADIYSLGCILYFLLTGHPPYPEGSISERLLKHQIATPPSILKDRPDAPAKLLHICEKMMAKTPQERYQSADELLGALDSCEEDD